jgi:hypothetical protein
MLAPPTVRREENPGVEDEDDVEAAVELRVAAEDEVEDFGERVAKDRWAPAPHVWGLLLLRSSMDLPASGGGAEPQDVHLAPQLPNRLAVVVVRSFTTTLPLPSLDAGTIPRCIIHHRFHKCVHATRLHRSCRDPTVGRSVPFGKSLEEFKSGYEAMPHMT